MSGSIPYLGSKISLITTSDIRYEGILYTLNREESTIAVQNVRSFGTEGRRIPEVPTTNEIYDFIIFRGKDLKDLTVLQGAPERQAPYTGNEYLDATNQPYPHGSGQQGYAQDQCGPGGGSAPGGGGYNSQYQSRQPRDAGHQQHGGYQQASQPTQPPPPAPAQPSSALQPPQPREPAAGAGGDFGRGVSAEGPSGASSLAYDEDDKARGRGKGGGGQKKPVFEVLRFHRRAEESLARAAKAQGASALNPAELRAMSEQNPPVYHFYLDFVNYCCAAHLAQSDEQQWETLSKALKKHFERDLASSFAQGFNGNGFTPGAEQQQKPAPPPQRPNNTLGDFISLEAAAARPGRKGAKAPRGGAPAGPAPGRGGGKAGRMAGGAGMGPGGADDAADFFEESPPASAANGGAASSWSCPRCTLRNEAFLTECAACGSSKQQAALWAEFPPLA